MAGSCAWLSVTVRRCQEVLKARQVVQCPWDDCFASLLSKIDSKFEEETISHIHISRNENFLDPHVVDATAPVSICHQFTCMHVCIFLRMFEVVQPVPTWWMMTKYVN